MEGRSIRRTSRPRARSIRRAARRSLISIWDLAICSTPATSVTWRRVAPRGGFTWNAGGKGTLVVRGGSRQCYSIPDSNTTFSIQSFNGPISRWSIACAREATG